MTTYLPIFVCNEITETLFPNYFHDANKPIFKRKRFTKRNEKKDLLQKCLVFSKCCLILLSKLFLSNVTFFADRP
jgi:hypothetical protein